MKNIIKLTLDRIEDEIAYCYDDNEKQYKLNKNTVSSLHEGDIFTVSCENGEYVFISLQQEETDQKKAELKNRLTNLFNKKR